MSERRVIEVWNKLDLTDVVDREVLRGDALRSTPAAVPVSAVTGEGCDILLGMVADLVDDAAPVGIDIPVGEGAALAWLYRHGRIISRRDTESGEISLAVSLTEQALGQFEQTFPRLELRAL